MIASRFSRFKNMLEGYIMSGTRSRMTQECGPSAWSGRGQDALTAASPAASVLVNAASASSSSASRVSAPVYPPSKRTALATIASNTGWTSVCERLMTRKMSLVAVCVSSAVVSSRLLACSSLNSRTFSMAMTA